MTYLNKIFNGLIIGLSKGLDKRGLLHAYIPRYIVFFIDILLSSAAFFTVVTFFYMLLGVGVPAGIDVRFFTSIGVYVFFNLFFRMYKGTVRYTGIGEIVRLFLYCACCSLSIVIIYELLKDKVPGFNVSLIWAFLHGFTTFIFLFIFRIAVRYTYYFLSVSTSKRKRVLMYGVDPNTIAIAQLFASDVSSDYKPVAFLDALNNSSKNMRIGVMPVKRMPEDMSDFRDMVTEIGVEAIVLTQERLKRLTHQQADELLAGGVRLMAVGETSDINDQNKKARVSVNEIKIEDLLDREVIKTDNSVVAEKHRGRVVLVTGAAGSIGSEVVMQVAAYQPSLLILMDQAESPLYDMEMKLKNEFKNLNFMVFIGDVRNKQRMEELFSTYRPHAIYHAAAYKHVPMMEKYPAEAIRVNVMGTKMVADLAVRYGARKFVMVSTDKAVNPTNVMGASKRIAEIYVQSLFLMMNEKDNRTTKFITTRFGNVLGSNGSVVPLFKNQIAKGGPITVTHKDIIRYFMTIPEACRLVLEAGCMGKGGEIFVFDMGEPVKIYDLAVRMIRLSGLEPDRDIKIMETGLRPGEKLFEELLNDKETTLPTHNKKIMVAKVRRYDYEVVKSLVENLISAATAGDNEDTVRRMKVIVPEFKSKNSVYEILDAEVNAAEVLQEVLV